ncbi:hypothetical protein CI102_15280 [Trichoderma harzianum]|nr:hypothetical protein CI102_15280 [Trichoderma harzianum]
MEGIILSTVKFLPITEVLLYSDEFSGEALFSDGDLWDRAIRMFWHAGEAKDTPENRLDINIAGTTTPAGEEVYDERTISQHTER